MYRDDRRSRPGAQPRAAAERIAIGVVVHEGSVLVGRRGGPPMEGYAEFPGGRVLPGESVEGAVRREIREETGLEAEVQELLARNRVAYPHGVVDLHFFLCRPPASGAAARPRTPFRWIPVAALPTLRFPPANDPVLRWFAASREG